LQTQELRFTDHSLATRKVAITRRKGRDPVITTPV
jgi:hypothetical protein